MTKLAIEIVTQEALDAFWSVVFEHYPSAVAGDISPLTQIRFSATAEQAVSEWVANNVPEDKGGDHD